MHACIGKKDKKPSKVSLEKEGAQLKLAKCTWGYVCTHRKQKSLTINRIDSIVPDMETKEMRILDPGL